MSAVWPIGDIFSIISSDKIMLNEVEEIEEKWEKYKTKRRGSYKKKKVFL